MHYAHDDYKNDKEFFITHIVEKLEPKNMIEALCAFIKSAKDSEFNDILLMISKRCRGNKDYLAALFESLNYSGISEEIKNLIGHMRQIIGPKLISMIPEYRLGELLENLSLIEKTRENPEVKKEGKLKAFNHHLLTHIGQYLNYMDKVSLLGLLHNERVDKQEDHKTKSIDKNSLFNDRKR